MKKDLSLYIHIPFCNSKCNYCSFNSFENCIGLQDEYVKRVIEEKCNIVINAVDISKKRHSQQSGHYGHYGLYGGYGS